MTGLHYDVLVIGGGHAGCEAAAAAARLGASVGLVTPDKSKIGEMSCNPAIGGLGKGHLVREIDALDGLMGRVADKAGIQFRLLNRSRGPAVRGPRTQADRGLYKAAVQEEIAKLSEITIIEAYAEDLNRTNDGKVCGVKTSQGDLKCRAVVITTGTFLGGLIHLGHERIPAGRFGEAPSLALAKSLRASHLKIGRMKTGTPPRLLRSSIDYTNLTEQPGDSAPFFFSSMTCETVAPQVSCYITRTCTHTHTLIRDGLANSPLFNGQISGIGPRYCPSIEDKVVRFSDRSSHQVFLEPEGWNDDLVYPNGISTSLPPELQEKVVHSIPGLEHAEIKQYGYAIEYDYIDPRSLRPSLEVKTIPGLFLSGQINGTTGYEEAAGQGLIAGCNAALQAGGGHRDDMFHVKRSEGYLGVMIDDLVTQGVTEPYRMFTSRAEFRLALRADTADDRLTPMGTQFGLISYERQHHFETDTKHRQELLSCLKSQMYTPTEISLSGSHVSQDGQARSAYDWMRHSNIPDSFFRSRLPETLPLTTKHFDRLRSDAIYSGYEKRQQTEIAALKENEACILRHDIDYGDIGGISNEIKEKLQAVSPETIGQASRIPGITPAAVLALLRYVQKIKSHAH